MFKELKKIKALCKYSDILVDKAGRKDQKNKAKLYGIDNSEYFKQLLYVETLCINFNENDGVEFSVRDRLYKRIEELGNKLEYITLLDPLDGDRYKSDFYYYSTKKDIDDCESLIKLKRKARDMIKNPSKYFISR